MSFIEEMWPLRLINDFIMIWGFVDDNPHYIKVSCTTLFPSFVLIKESVFPSHLYFRGKHFYKDVLA